MEGRGSEAILFGLQLSRQRGGCGWRGGVVDLVDVGGIVGRLSGLGGLCGWAGVWRGGVRVVETYVVPEDAMKAYGVEVGVQIARSEVFAVALGQGEGSLDRAEDLLTKVGEGRLDFSRVIVMTELDGEAGGSGRQYRGHRCPKSE